MRVYLTALSCVFLIGCAATLPTITKTQGNPNLTSYKTFSVKSNYAFDSYEYFREFRMLNNLIVRFEQEGFHFVRPEEGPDMILSLDYTEKILQDYVPPSVHTEVSYEPGMTNINTMGTITNVGGGVSHINAHSVAQSSGEMVVTTTTTAGHYVPFIALDLAINAYDAKTKQLLWSGEGASRVKRNSVDAQTDRIMVDVIDNHLMSPAYLSGERAKYRKSGLERYLVGPVDYVDEGEDEFLKPNAPPEQIGASPKNLLTKVDDIEIFSSLILNRQLINVTLYVTNKSQTPFVINLNDCRVVYKGQSLQVLNKEDALRLFFNLGKSGVKRDNAIKAINKMYFEQQSIDPSASAGGVFYVLSPVAIRSGDEVKVSLSINGKEVILNYVYEKDWMLVKDFKPSSK